MTKLRTAGQCIELPAIPGPLRGNEALIRLPDGDIRGILPLAASQREEPVAPIG